MSDLRWFIGIMFILFIGWLVSGGPARYSANKPFIRAPEPLDNGEVYGPSNLFGLIQSSSSTSGTTGSGSSAYPSSWKQMNTQYFVLYVPSGWSMRELPSDKTYRGEITNGTTVLTFDYGKDVNTLPYEGNPFYTISNENIGTYPTKIVMPAGGTSGTTGAYYKKNFKKYKLVITGENLSKKEQTTALSIFRSVRFKVQ